MNQRTLLFILAFLAPLLLLPAARAAGGIPEPGILLYGRITFGLDLLEEGTVEITCTPMDGNPSVTVSGIIEPFTGPIPLNTELSYKVEIPVETVLPGMKPSSGALLLSDVAVTYLRTIIITYGTVSKTFTDEFTLPPGGQRGAVERRDYNVKDYSPEQIIAGILGRPSLPEKMDPNGDQVLDITDLVHVLSSSQ